MTDPRTLIHTLVLLACAVFPAAAQQPAQPPADALASIRTKDVLAEEDRTAIRTFVTERFAALQGDDAGLAQEAFAQLRTAYEGSRGFREAYAGIVIQAVGQGFGSAKDVPAARMITLIYTLNVADAAGVLIEALKDPRAGVRAAAAATLRGLRERLAQAGADFAGRALAALRDAARRETARDVLKEMYQAMNYAGVAGGADPRVAAAAILDVLDDRARKYAAGEEISAAGADEAGFRAASGVLANLSEEERKRLLAAAGTMMKRALVDYTSGENALKNVKGATGAAAELRDNTIALLDEGEKLLTAVLAPKDPPRLGERMRKADVPGMKLQWKAWADLLKQATGGDYSLSE
jgi:hypothetical protein